MTTITETIEYLKSNRDRMIKFRSVPGTNILDLRAKETVEQLNQLIEELTGYIEYEREFITKRIEDREEAWKTFQEENPHLFSNTNANF